PLLAVTGDESDQVRGHRLEHRGCPGENVLPEPGQVVVNEGVRRPVWALGVDGVAQQLVTGEFDPVRTVSEGKPVQLVVVGAPGPDLIEWSEFKPETDHVQQSHSPHAVAHRSSGEPGLESDHGSRSMYGWAAD